MTDDVADFTLMAAQTLSFVPTAADAALVPDDHEVVVLSPWFIAAPADAQRVRGILPSVVDVLRQVDVPSVSLDLFDRWALSAGLPAHFVADGVNWWQRVRMTLRWDVYELVLWRLVVGTILAGRDGTTPVKRAIVPPDRPMLAAACRALGLEVTENATAAVPAAVESSGPAPKAILAGGPLLRLASRLGWACAELGLPFWHPGAISIPLRVDILARRFRRLAVRRPILVLTWSGSQQVEEAGRAVRLGDPFLDPATERLAGAQTVAVVMLGRGYRKGADWRAVVADRRALPSRYVDERWAPTPEADGGSTPQPADILGLVVPPLLLDGCDLSSAALELVSRYAGPWLDTRRETMAVAGRFLDDLQPAAILLNREGTRTTWIAAAQARGIPVVSTQHGMIYPGNPEYFHPQVAGVPRVDRTCVFGPYERDLLVDGAGFDPGTVMVTGSPRTDSLAAPVRDLAARDALRSRLGVRPGERMLVVSAAHNAIGEMLTAAMMTTVLCGDLPGVHIVVKVHPQDHHPADYQGFLAGLAVAGGYAPPAVSVVRDVDLVELLQAADAHLGQTSTVLTDAAAAGTPNLVAVTLAHSDLIGYVEAGVGTAVGSVDDVRAALAPPRVPDPVAREAFLRAHFEPGDAAARLAQVVLDAAAERAAATEARR